jgi:hypothetical protein
VPRIAIVGSFDLDDLGDALALRIAARELRRRVWRGEIVVDGSMAGSRFRDAEQPELAGDGSAFVTTFAMDPALMLALTPGLLGEGERELRVGRLRHDEILPDGDIEVLASGGVLVAGGVRLPENTTADDLVAVLSWAGRVTGDWEDARRIAASFGRPVRPAVETDGARAVAMLDDVAARAASGQGESEAAWAGREAELQAVIRSLSFELVEKDIRFVRLWRKIHEGDRHYHWHKRRADEAEAHVWKLEREASTLRKLVDERDPSERERLLMAEVEALRARLEDPSVAEAARLDDEVAWLRGLLEERDAQIARLRRNPLRRGVARAKRRLGGGS